MFYMLLDKHHLKYSKAQTLTLFLTCSAAVAAAAAVLGGW